MFETFMHVMGLCPDHFAHFNFLDIIMLGGGTYVTMKWNSIKAYFKSKRKRK